jgi:hypothetical protein
VFQRIDQAGFKLPLDERVLADTDTLLVFGLDHISPDKRQGDLDTKGWLKEVKTFNFHMHLPHYAVTTDDPRAVHVLAKQPIDTSKPHPFTDAGNTEFNMFLWMPPDGNRAGDVLFADSTIFSTLFGAGKSPKLLEKYRHGKMKPTHPISKGE